MLINLRNALMAGKRLPYDAEVEYIQFNGTTASRKYINTGIKVADPSAIKIEVVADAILPLGFFHNNAASGTWVCSYYNSRNGTVRVYYKNYSSTNLITSPSSVDSYVFDGGSGFYINGTLYATFSASVGTDSIANKPWWFGEVYDFNYPDGHTYSGYNRDGKLYSLKIYVSNTLVRDFIPVRKDTVGYLYDRVSGKLFGNAGTGDFVLGPDVVPVEYIESHGTEYIDTGVPATGATDSEFQFKMSIAGFAFGARTAWNASAYSLNYAAGNYAFNYGNNSVVADLKTNIRIDTNWHTAKIQSGGVLSLDEWTGTAGTFSFTTNESLILFGTRQGSSLNLTASGFKYCKIWDNSLPVRSFRPVRVGTDATSWEGAMMDVLTRRIYRNAGTGAFTYGNDLKYPIPSE